MPLVSRFVFDLPRPLGEGWGEDALTITCLPPHPDNNGRPTTDNEPAASTPAKFFSRHPVHASPILKTSPKSCIETLQCSILQHPKKMGEPGCQWLAGTQIRPRRAEITQFASFCGRWADLANFCSDRWFRSRAVVPLRLTGPSCLFRPRALLLC